MVLPRSTKIKCDYDELLNQTIFKILPPEKLQEVRKNAFISTYSKGQNLITKGVPVYGVAFILDGLVKVGRTEESGKEVIFCLEKAGGVAGLHKFFLDPGQPDISAISAVAIEETVVCFIETCYLKELVITYPILEHLLFTMAIERLNRCYGRITSFTENNVRERLANLLIFLKEFVGVWEDKKWKLNIKLSREEIASLIGAACETSVRFLTELKEDGIIYQKNKYLYINDMIKLEELGSC